MIKFELPGLKRAMENMGRQFTRTYQKLLKSKNADIDIHGEPLTRAEKTLRKAMGEDPNHGR